MSLAVLLFEDHTAQHFRPLSWSLPVHELPCGLYNLRERLGFVLAARPDAAAVLLPRGFLRDLQDLSVPAGFQAGPEAAAQAVDGAERVLWLSSRLAARGADLESLLDHAVSDAVAADDDGPLLVSCTPAGARELLAGWRAWDGATAETGEWTRPNHPVTPWLPHLPIPSVRVHAWRRLWERVPELATALNDDRALAVSTEVRRDIFGIVPEAGDDPLWARPSRLSRMAAPPQGVTVIGDGGVWCGPEVTLDPSVVLDTRHGPILLEREATVRPGAVLTGPLALGVGSIVKSHASVGPEVVVGAVGRVAGEIAESQLLPFANKQHAGFLGHALVAGWTNLGADTTNSDLKNNYGMIKVNAGLGPEDAGTRFLGLMMAEHAKSAIGTTFNTATTVGFAANVFAAGFPRTCIGNFSWGDGRGKSFQVERALETATIVMSRRGAHCSEAHARLFRALAEGSS